MSQDDFAIVVGISRYPSLGEPPNEALDLRGPENDTGAVVEWLKNSSGGDIPDANIKTIKSAQLASSAATAGAGPSRDEIEDLFLWLHGLAVKNKDSGRGMTAGRRLYVYMSGHGFSPRPSRGCLFTANATMDFGANVYPSAWLDWFRDSGYFSEFVLWLDCCMNRVGTIPPSEVQLAPKTSPEAAGPTFIAFAAQRPLKAVELAIPEDAGKIHGVFTWALLEGLRGAAVNEFGVISGRSLADWLRNAQKGRMASKDLSDPDVAQEPEVVKEDPGIIFARGLPPKEYPVTLLFPSAANGAEARLWCGRPPRVSSPFKVAGAANELRLRPGLYVVDVPSAGLRHGFEVTSSTSLAISEQGAPVKAGNGGDFFDLDISPGDPGAENFVLDDRFGLIDKNPGSLHPRLPFGIYKVKTRVGRSVNETIILLDGDRPPLATFTPQIASAAPLPSALMTHEYHEDAAIAATETAHITVADQANATAGLSVMARVWTPVDDDSPDARPWEGVIVVNARSKMIANLENDGVRKTLADLKSEGHPSKNADPYGVCSLSVTPGAYFLRQRLHDAFTMEQSLVVPANWRIDAYTMRVPDSPDSNSAGARPHLSILLRRLGEHEKEDEDKLLDTARIALADERRVMSEELEELLLRKFDNPIAGIIGAHLLLIENERDPRRDLRLLNEVVTNLRGIVGTEHPDVEALSLECPNKDLRRVNPVRVPPMFQRSWKLLVHASKDRLNLVPRVLWRRVQMQIVVPPYFVWRIDENAKAAYRRELSVAIWGDGSQTTARREQPLAAAAKTLPPGTASIVAEHPSPERLALARLRAIELQVPASSVRELWNEYAANQGG